MNEVDSNQRVQFCEFFQRRMLDNAVFEQDCSFRWRLNLGQWYGESSQFPLSVTWKFAYSWGKGTELTRNYFLAWNIIQGFQQNVLLWRKFTDLAYLNILGTPLVPVLRDPNGNEEFYCQQDGAPHIPIVTSGATWLNFQAGCTGRRGSVEYQPRSLDLTPLDFHLLMYVKDAAFLIKPTSREALREDMEGLWAAISVYTHSSAEFRNACIWGRAHYESLS